jgi:hypothetical protein
MDIEAHRQRYLAELEAATEPPETRAGDLAPTARRARTGAALIETIDSLSLRTDDFSDSAGALLDILADETAPSAARLAAFRKLAGAEFRPHRFEPFAARFVEIQRLLATHKDRELRTAVLEHLALAGDRVAQKVLREGLLGQRKALVPTAKAIQLLAQDDHASAKALFRDLAKSGKGQVKEEALRTLADDKRSASLLEEVASDRAEKPQIRQLAAMSLKEAAPSRFAKFARQLALDDTDDDNVRAAAVSGLAYSPAGESLIGNAKFAQALEAAGSATKSRALKASIKGFARARDNRGR